MSHYETQKSNKYYYIRLWDSFLINIDQFIFEKNNFHIFFSYSGWCSISISKWCWWYDLIWYNFVGILKAINISLIYDGERLLGDFNVKEKMLLIYLQSDSSSAVSKEFVFSLVLKTLFLCTLRPSGWTCTVYNHSHLSVNHTVSSWQLWV